MGRLPAARAGAALLSIYLGFYIHQDDLSSQLALQKRVLFVSARSGTLALLISELAGYTHRVNGEPVGEGSKGHNV